MLTFTNSLHNYWCTCTFGKNIFRRRQIFLNISKFFTQLLMHKLKTTQWVIEKRLKMFLHLKIRSSEKILEIVLFPVQTSFEMHYICFTLRCLSSIYFEKANLFQGGRGRWMETGNWFKWKQMKLSYISVIWNQDPQILKTIT